MTCFTRRWAPALLLVLLGFACVRCSNRPPVPESGAQASRSPGRLRLLDLPNVDVRDVPMLMALDDLEGQGYTIEKTNMSSGSLIADALARGDADIGLVNSQTMWLAIAKGAPVRTIAKFTSPTTIVVAGAGIRSCQGLDGKRLGVATTAGLSPILFRLHLQGNCPGTEPRFIVIGESAGRAAALLAGEIDALIAPGEEFVKLQHEAPGKFHALMSYAEEFPDVLIDCLHVRLPWAEQHRRCIKDFLGALFRAQRRVMSSPGLLVDESVRRLGLDRATAEAVSRAHLSMAIWDANGGPTTHDVQKTIDLMTEMAVLPRGLRVSDVADLSYLNEVLDEIGRQ
jgi:ABC-type nitrate/sulfonate/bicarbonate transport system substrate-binding protein